MAASGSLPPVSASVPSSGTGRPGRSHGRSVRFSTSIATAASSSAARSVSAPAASANVVDSRDDLLAIIRQEFQSLLQQFPPSSAAPLNQPPISASPGLSGVGWFLVMLLAFSVRYECVCVCYLCY